MKRALIIRHVPHEGIAAFREPVEAAGYAIDRVDVSDPRFGTLDLRDPDLLVMMGGPMGVYEQDQHPWIACQLRRLALRLAADRPTLGVCFGAQMIAAALGAEVFAGPRQEIGFHRLELHGSDPGPLRHLAGVPVLHWHGDTFTLPEGVRHLASTPHYTNQAFARGSRILALQFHAEMGEDARFHDWLEAWPEAPASAGQTVEALRHAYRAKGPHAVRAGRAMIAEWLEGISE